MILSKLEDGKRNNLLHELRELTEKHNMLEAKLEASTLRYKELEKRRHRPSGHRVMATDLAVLEEARQEEASLRHSISGQLHKLIEGEKKIQRMILASMNKSKSCEMIQNKERQLQKKMDAHIEQQSIDDLMAHRCTQRR